MASADEPVAFPAEFDDNGEKWTKSTTVSESDKKRLSGYFKKNPSLAEGPLISGEPTLYISAQGEKRFYWGRQNDHGPEWIFIQFQGRHGIVKEGTGAPLPEAT